MTHFHACVALLAVSTASFASAKTISGTIRDAITKKPLSLVTVWSPQGRAPVESTSSGAWGIEIDPRWINDTNLEVRARKNGYETYSEKLNNLRRIAGSFVIDLEPLSTKLAVPPPPKTVRKSEVPGQTKPQSDPSSDWSRRQATLTLLQSDRARALASIDTIVQGTQDPVNSVRQTAISTIRTLKLQTRATTEALVALVLERRNFDLACAAAETLSEIGPKVPAVRKALTTVMSDGDLQTRLCATRAYLRIDPAATDIVATLAAIMVSDEKLFPDAAVEIALSNGSLAEQLASSLGSYVSRRGKKSREVFKIAEQFVDGARQSFVLSLLANCSWSCIEDALDESEAAHAEPIVAASLVRAVLDTSKSYDPCYDARDYASVIKHSVTLSVLGREEAAERLLQASSKLGRWSTCDTLFGGGRQAYFNGIGHIGADAVLALKAALQQDRPDTDWVVAWLYLNSGGNDPQVLDALAAMLDSGRFDSQIEAVRTLSWIKPAQGRAVQLLMRATTLRHTAARAIEALAAGNAAGREREVAFRNAAANLTLDEDSQRAALKAIMELSSIEAETLQSLFFIARQGSTSNIQSWAISAIAKRIEAMPSVIALLDAKRPQPDVQLGLDVIKVMGKSALPAVPALIGLFGSQYEHRAIGAIGKIAPSSEHEEKAIAGLIAVLRARPRPSDNRAAAVDALGDFGPAAAEALPYLKSLLNDPDESLRRNASGAIAKVSQ
jgi:hypothetical protein